MSVVLDASVAVELVAGVDAADVEGSVRRAASSALIAPAVFWLEVASAMRGLVLRGGLTSMGRDRALRRLRALDIAIEPATTDVGEVVRVSDTYQLTIYDAAYLELAMRSDSALATRDGALVSAARRAGVELA